MGLSELFASVASYEFAYVAAPRAAQSLFMSLRFCSSGVASLIATAYIRIFTSWDANFGVRTRISFLIEELIDIVYSVLPILIHNGFPLLISSFLLVFN